MPDIRCYGRTTRNGRGRREVDIEYHPTLLQSLFFRSGTKKVFEQTSAGIWINVSTGRQVNYREQMLINDIEYNLDRQNANFT